MSNKIFLNFNQIIERLNSQGIEYDKKQMKSIFNMFDIEDESGTIGVKDDKLTNTELTHFFSYLRLNYVERFINAFNDIEDNLSQEHEEISSDNEFYSPKRSVQLQRSIMAEFDALSKEEKDRVKDLLYIEGRGENGQLIGEDLLKIAKLPQDEYNRIKEFLVTPGRYSQYNADEMIALTKIPKEKHHIFNNPARGKQQISPLLAFENENNEEFLNNLERLSLIKVNIKDLLRRNNGERFLEEDELSSIMQIIDKYGKVEQIIQILQDPLFNNCKIDDIQKVLRLSEEELNNVKNILKNPPSNSDNILDGAIDLSKLTPEEFKIAQKYYNIPERGTQQLRGSGIASIAKLTDEERKFADENGLIYSLARKRQLNGTVICTIAKMKSNVLQDFLRKNPNFQFVPSINENIVTLKDNKGVEHVFDKDGLVSTRELVSEENLPDGRLSNTYKTINYRLHSEQETKLIELENATPKIYSIQTNYFDENNNLIKTLTLKENNNSSYDASISYPNGEIKPLQYSSYNEESGIGTIERHFISPEGIKTDYYYEDSVDGTRIVDYKITDSTGKIILNEHNTFQQISENEFLSTSNDKSYKIEFKDGIIVITDTKTNKQNSINIDDIVENPEQKNIVINYLKNIPASQLMFLTKQPITMQYSTMFMRADNGFYDSKSKQMALMHPFLDNDLNLFTLSHEWGHYIDLFLNGENGIISSDETLKNIYQEELANFLKYTNTDEQSMMSYLMQDGTKSSERVGDANALRHTGKNSGIRDFYFQQYFPRTIARIIELIRAEEARVAE